MTERRSLVRHPDAESAIDSIDVSIERTGAAGFTLRFELRGAIDVLVLPESPAPARRDELWRSTCFEAFLRGEGRCDYLELNLAASGDWNVYRLTGYREGLAPAPVPAPRIGWAAQEERATLVATVDLGPAGVASEALSVGLSAIIEERCGRKSYWALAHPAGKPDFHAEAGFVLRLPAVPPAA
jgi:hypothetical protein